MSAKSTYPDALSKIVKYKWRIICVLLALLMFYAFMIISGAIKSINFGLTPPELPQYQDHPIVYTNPTGWPNTDSEWFHHATQGTATIPIPYQWLVALEQPKSNPWRIFFAEEPPYIGEYMLRLGFIKEQATELNPDALPIGIARTESMFFPGINRKAVAVGFTCAACHTGQLIHDGKRYVVDGGPAMTDLGLLTQSLGAALGQTALSSKFTLLNGRFERFARSVLGSNDNILTRTQLRKDLERTLKQLAIDFDTVDVTEGFTRLDALNRIGNQVFHTDLNRPANYAPINAPVNFPHLWTTSWFDWVQYDGSIMQPLIRNTGEALGVEAFVDTQGPDNQRFASSVDINNLVKIENWMAGTHPAKNGNRFNGLLAPKWPAEFPAINAALAGQGKELYAKMCQRCHLPPIDSAEFWSAEHWREISYIKDGQLRKTDDTYLTVKVVPLKVIGTDPAQAGVLANRTVDTSGLNLNTEVCTIVELENANGQLSSALAYVPLNDSATSNFALALGAFVERTNQQWFSNNYIPSAARPEMEGARPNCLQADVGYKARPLDGIWATAPFLHNGSVATIFDLLSPPDERPKLVELGDQTFDVDHVGIKQGKAIKALNANFDGESYKTTADYSYGRFILDTRQPGNYNTGHAFADGGAAVAGRIGRKLEENERLALIEYLKTL